MFKTKFKKLKTEKDFKGLEFSYLESLALSLVEYASQNRVFAKNLISLIKNIDDHSFEYEGGTYFKTGKYLCPEDTETAIVRAVWLISRINGEKGPSRDSATQILLEWKNVYPYESPKQVIVGVAATSVPGFTLGQVSRKKNMSLVLDKKLRKDNDLDLGRLSVQASCGIITRSLEQVGGKADKLEPDVSMWICGERGVNFYQTYRHKLEIIKEELDSFGVVNEGIKRDGKLIALALSPVVNRPLSEKSWDLEFI